MDTVNPLYPWPSQAQLARESDREAREAEAAKDMQPIEDVFRMISGARDHLKAVMAQLPPKAAYWADYHAGGLTDWIEEARSDIGGMVKQHHGVE